MARSGRISWKSETRHATPSQVAGDAPADRQRTPRFALADSATPELLQLL
jgi:hypothetical protein